MAWTFVRHKSGCLYVLYLSFSLCWVLVGVGREDLLVTVVVGAHIAGSKGKYHSFIEYRRDVGYVSHSKRELGNT